LNPPFEMLFFIIKMSAREILLAASADYPLDMTKCRNGRAIYFNNDNEVYYLYDRIHVYVEDHNMTVTFTYPDFEPVAMRYTIYAWAWISVEHRMSNDIKYIDLMISLIIYTTELTARHKKLNDKVISTCKYDIVLIKRGDVFKIPLPAETEKDDCFDELVALAHEDPFLFDAWEEKLNILRAGLPQPIFEEIETVAVFFSE